MAMSEPCSAWMPKAVREFIVVRDLVYVVNPSTAETAVLKEGEVVREAPLPEDLFHRPAFVRLMSNRSIYGPKQPGDSGGGMVMFTWRGATRVARYGRDLRVKPRGWR